MRLALTLTSRVPDLTPRIMRPMGLIAAPRSALLAGLPGGAGPMDMHATGKAYMEALAQANAVSELCWTGTAKNTHSLMH